LLAAVIVYCLGTLYKNPSLVSRLSPLRRGRAWKRGYKNPSVGAFAWNSEPHPQKVRANKSSSQCMYFVCHWVGVASPNPTFWR